MKEIFIQEKEKRISPFDVDGEEIDYEKLIKEFGVEPIENLKNKKEIENIDFYKRGRIISHRDFDKFLDAIKSGKKVSIVSGLNASGSMHFGHRGAFDLCLELQKKYKIPVFIPISDDEAYVCKKIKNQEEGLKNAELIAKQVAALGFDPKLTKIFIHQKYTKIYNLAIKLSTKYTLSTIKAIYGFKDETNPGLMFYPVIQAADILLPQELYGPHLTLVPVAIDQDPHIRLARDIAEKFGYVKPAALHIKFLHGLRGGKMSKSREGSALFLNEDLLKVKKLCMNTLTGGQETIELQRKFGGKPNLCIVHEYLSCLFDDNLEITKEREKLCLEGKILCGDDKKVLCEKFLKYLKEFQEKVKNIKIEEFLLKE